MATLISGSTGVDKIQDGTIVDADIASGAAIAGSKLVMPTGSVLQVVQQVHHTFTQINNSSSYVDTGLTQAITPSSSSNKILVVFSIQLGTNSTSSQNIQARLLAGSTVIRMLDNIHNSVSHALEAQASFQYLHSPSTTSAVTYKLQMKGTSSAHFRINNYNSSANEACSTMTLMEIAG